MIADNVLKVMAQIDEACRKAGRKSSEITLVGVTKFAPIDAIEQAIDTGVTHIAENRVQEAQRKFSQLMTKYPLVVTNLIGHLQTNKAGDALAVCRLIQSIDSLKLASEIQKQALKQNRIADILVQINTAQEYQKFGVASSQALALLEGIGQLSHLRVKGVMAMAPLSDDEGLVRKAFADLRVIKDEAKTKFAGHLTLSFDVCSMGMSGDLQIAIEEGSTMVRIGSAIFKEAYEQH